MGSEQGHFSAGHGERIVEGLMPRNRIMQAAGRQQSLQGRREERQRPLPEWLKTRQAPAVATENCLNAGVHPNRL